MGRVAAPYGVKGWIKVLPMTARPDTLLGFGEWWIRQPSGDGAWNKHTLETGRRHGATLLVQLSDVADRESAAVLSGADVGVPRTALPATAENEFYWSAIEGLEVVNRQGVSLGRVVGLQDFGAHPILRVADVSGLERLIPFVEAYVDSVSIEDGRVEVDWQLDY